MRKDLIRYGIFCLSLLMFSCVPAPDCSVNSVQTDVQGKTVSVNISAQSSSDLVQFNWYFSDGFSKATTEPFVSYTLTQNGNYSVQVEAEDAEGAICNYEAGFIIDDITIVEDTCDIDISHFEIDGDQITAEVELEGSYDNAQFTWSTGDGYEAITSSSEFVYSYAQSGNYNFEVSYTRGECADSTKKVIRIEEDLTWGECEVELINEPLIQNKTISLNVNQVQAANVKYKWSMGDGSQVMQTNSPNYVYTYSNGGTFEVTVMIEYGSCFAEEVFEVEIPYQNIGNNNQGL